MKTSYQVKQNDDNKKKLFPKLHQNMELGVEGRHFREPRTEEHDQDRGILLPSFPPRSLWEAGTGACAFPEGWLLAGT